MRRSRPLADYALIESRDPSATEEIKTIYDLAHALLRMKNQVTVILVGEGVRAAVAGHHAFWFASIRRRGARIVADAASLVAQGLRADQVAPAIEVTPEGVPVDALWEGKRLLWITDWVSPRAA